MPKEAEWKYIHDTADMFIKRLTDGIEIVLSDLKKEINISEIESALERNDPVYLINIINFEDNLDSKFMKQYEKVADTIMSITGTEAWNRLNIPISFNIRNPYAELYIAQHIPEITGEISLETKKAIQSIILDGFQSGFPPREMAKRIKNMIGLTERDSIASFRYWKKLYEDKELKDSIRNNMSDRYAKRLLRRRAENIARTETINAANQGTLNSWRTAQDEGYILPETQKEWIAATASDRTCRFCRPMDAQKVNLDEQFYSELLSKHVDGPTLHPSCRCTIALVTPRIS